MAINIGRTGTAGRFIGGGAGVFQDNALRLYIDPYRYDCFTAETDSSMEDLSGWGNDLTCVNGARDFLNGFWYLDGSDDFAYRTDDSDFDFSTNIDFSVQIWYKNLGSGSTFYLIQKGYQYSSSVGWTIHYSDDAGKLYLHLGTETTHTQDGDETWDSGWINLAVTVDRDSSVKFYKNGNLVETDIDNSTNHDLSNSGFLTIGGNNPFSSTSTVANEFNGYLGPILIYNGLVLSEDRIRQNFNVHRGIFGV